MRFRQIHLDFHTSPLIPGIGEKFNKKEWQETLKRAEVNSITLFATCHHGYAYYNTKVGARHPHLNFDLLRAQVDACKEIDVKTPIYLTAGINSYASEIHPEWGEIDYTGKIYDPLYPHFHKMCFNSPYLEFLCAQIREVAELFPEANGIFTDIIHQGQCCCRHCMKGMLESGLDPRQEEDRRAYAKKVLLNYYQKTYEAAKWKNPDMPIFHNSGHITIDNREILPYFSHLELESLPTGGWGYDHYPMSAAYVRNLGMEFLGMTGKFQTTWGEFGGFKHPNALRYECAAMIANGSKCSVGDQLHPSGKLDSSTYEIIGAAYREVRQKEAWCEGAESAAEIAILSGFTPERQVTGRELPGDVGASRVLLESHLPFDLVDTEMDWNKYKFLLLPDEVRISEKLRSKLDTFMKNGGKLILSGTSGMALDKDEFVFDLPVVHEGTSPYQPDYVKAADDFAPDYVHTPFVMYLASQRIKVTGGISLGEIYDPYFNRTFEHFSSHQHTPNRTEASGYDGGVLTERILYFAHPVFSIYRAYGEAAVKQYIMKAIRRFLGKEEQVDLSGLPSQGRVTLMKQKKEARYILHLLYANTILRGGVVNLSGGTTTGRAAIEVIEDLNPTGPVTVSLKLSETVHNVRLVPEGEELKFSYVDGRLSFEVPAFTCHSMVELAF